jgi:succinylarginine dihydrolase
MNAVEVNFDGLVGPTHNYGGLARGNVASSTNAGDLSNPREAALQGLAKMRRLMEMGLVQGVLPPHERPHVPSLRKMGFTGSDADVVRIASMASPVLASNAASASAMWTANAATVSPSADAEDGRVHLTPANLTYQFHRAIETETTSRVLKAIFNNEAHFDVHEPVPFPTFGDEGAANHLRFTRSYGEPGVEMFVYGRSAFARDGVGRFGSRQAMEAGHVVATTHKLRRGGAILAQQSKIAIDAGAFHNDVVSVSNEGVFLLHEETFENQAVVIEKLRAACAALGFEAQVIEAARDALTVEEAVKSYLFNSQIVTLPSGGMAMILPSEAEETPRAKAFVDGVLATNGPIREAHYLDLRQSMRNGGGPACLRLRVVLTDAELAALGAGAILNEAKLASLEAVIRKLYRDRLSLADLGDPALLEEGRAALDAFSQILNLGSVHDFQRA